MSLPVVFEELPTQYGQHIGVATLCVEKTLNALSLEMTYLLTEKLRQWSNDASIAIVILQASGEKAFCAGGDLQNLYKTMLAHHGSPQREDILGNAYARDFFEHEYRLDYMIHTFPKPILCWGHGIVMGGGIGLMAGCSHRVVTERSRLAMPEITIGLYPDVGASWFLCRMPGHLGLFLALTGATMNAIDAQFVGLADYRISHSEKQTVFSALQQQPWDGINNAVILQRVLQQAQRACPQTIFATSALRHHFDVINEVCSLPTLSEVVAAILAITTEDSWLQKAMKTLKAGSPGSACLSWALQKRARYLSLAQVFRLELVVSLHCATRPDFAEGIRALLIDKDLKPHWQPASLAEVSQAWVEGFFTDPWEKSLDAGQHPLSDLGASVR